jgi:hypothetical protein
MIPITAKFRTTEVYCVPNLLSSNLLNKQHIVSLPDEPSSALALSSMIYSCVTSLNTSVLDRDHNAFEVRGWTTYRRHLG